MDIVIDKTDDISTYNYFKDFKNHGLSQIVAERFFDALLKLDMISSWKKEDVKTMCIIGWKYELDLN